MENEVIATVEIKISLETQSEESTQSWVSDRERTRLKIFLNLGKKKTLKQLY